MRTHAITYATAYTSYLRDLRVLGSTNSLGQSVTSTRSDDHEIEPIIYESRTSPSVTIISPVGDRILLAVTGDFERPANHDDTETTQHSETAEEDNKSSEEEEEEEEEDLEIQGGTTQATGSSAQENHNDESALQQKQLSGPNGSVSGTFTPPDELVAELQEISGELAEVLRKQFEGMTWPSDL